MLMDTSTKSVTEWVPISGLWLPDSDGITYLGPDGSQQSSVPSASFGIALCNTQFVNGRVKFSVTLPEDPRGKFGQILLGFSSWQSSFLSVGISGAGAAFVALEHVPGSGWRPLVTAGEAANLAGNRAYQNEIGVEGQRITLSVGGIKVLDHIFGGKLNREQIGLYASGIGPIRFDSVEVSTAAYSAFVVMQFTDQFDDLFDEVIRPVCKSLDVEAYRASDIYRPGVIFQDILQGLDESSVVIADVTPPNPNVFYELGYSHALRKPVILLAERGTPLPFDISGYRAIFYDNTIGGKSAVEADLRRHLSSILRE